MRTVAILPVKRFGAAKTRLGAALGAGARRALAEAMLADVLAALGLSRCLDEIVVVTGEPSAGALACAHGARVVRDDDEQGQSAAARIGLRAAASARRAVLVPGDCPALDAVELDALLATVPPAPSVVVVPDRHGSGTNALVLTPPSAIVPAFGPGSRARHEAVAKAAGVACAVAQLPSLALDIDTGEDLEALRAGLDGLGLANRAPATRGLLPRDERQGAAR